MKKNIVLLSVAAIMAFASSASSLKNNNVVKEELDTRIIVEIDNKLDNKSRDQIVSKQNDVIQAIRATVSNQIKVNSGDKLTIGFNPDSLYFFDKESTLRIK